MLFKFIKLKEVSIFTNYDKYIGPIFSTYTFDKWPLLWYCLKDVQCFYWPDKKYCPFVLGSYCNKDVMVIEGCGGIVWLHIFCSPFWQLCNTISEAMVLHFHLFVHPSVYPSVHLFAHHMFCLLNVYSFHARNFLFYGHLCIYQRCSYYQDFYFSYIFTNLQIAELDPFLWHFWYTHHYTLSYF